MENYNKYFEALKDRKSQGTYEAYFYTVSRFISFLGERPPTQELAEEFLSTFREKGNSPRSILRHITALRHFFKWLKIQVDLGGPYVKRNLPPYIKGEEFKTMMREAKWNPRLKAALAILYGGGLRLSEAIGLQISDIDPKGYIRVMGKGGKERVVPVEDYIINIINEWINIAKMRSKWLFPSWNPNQHLGKASFQLMIKHHMESCGIEGKRVHSFRHGAGTSLYDKGMDLRQIQEFLGHENIYTTSLYVHLAPQRLRNDVIKAGRFKD